MTQPCETPIETLPAVREDLLARLRTDGPRHEDAIRELHALLLRAARFEIGRRSSALAQVRGEDADDLALQAADDAFVAVMGKLAQFRGDSRFSTWVYKFALYEAAVRVRRRTWQHREVVIDPDSWLTIDDPASGPAGRLQQTELLACVRLLIDTALTPRQRDVLAERLDSTRGALYKTLHDARRKLRSELSAVGHDLESICP
jgi:RNA polymerase sigma-70 factor (ECF subfamily)